MERIKSQIEYSFKDQKNGLNVDSWYNRMNFHSSDYRKGSRHFVFVYGTMMKGFINYSRLRHAIYIGNGITKEPIFDLYTKICGGIKKRYYAPVAVCGGSYKIYGEIYKVNGVNLFDLDMAEGHPDIYRRKQIVVDDFGMIWMYLFDPNKNKTPLFTHGIIVDSNMARFVLKDSHVH